MKSRRILYWASGVAVVAILLAGFTFLGSVLAYAKSSYGQFDVFTQVLKYINDNYVEDVDGEKLMDGAIAGMLEKLDPHSTYLDGDRNRRMQERNRGNFDGIGISFAIVEGNLTVISAIEGTPSHKLGLRPGDIITHIDRKSAKGIKEDEVFDQLRGPRGSTVHITVRREGVPDPMEYDIIRDQIPIFSVPYAFMLEPGVGYVRMVRFSATTSDELTEALDRLKREGMERLVLDLRGNAGGYLNEAIAVSDMFLPAGKKIVYTRGRLPDSNEDYYSTGRGRHQDYPLIVMVDHGSASASEIVSGAVQDWDRGLVVGETTFGKGLVQRQYPLRNGGALLLTVARYYTPSGRLIQRDYTDRDAYLAPDFAEAEGEIPEDGEANAEAPADSAGARPEFHTSSGRIVYGGGGITPDYRTTRRWPYPRLQQDLDRHRAYFEFASHYLGGRDLKYAGFDQFESEFAVGPELVSEFRSFLDRKKLAYDADSLRAQDDQVRRSIKAEFARSLFGENERYRVFIQADPALAEALGYFPVAAEMLAADQSRGASPRDGAAGRRR